MATLLRWLLERDLVDELNLRIYRIVVGDGVSLFRSAARRPYVLGEDDVAVGVKHDSLLIPRADMTQLEARAPEYVADLRSLVELRPTPSGVTLQTYGPGGRATFGAAGDSRRAAQETADW